MPAEVDFDRRGEPPQRPLFADPSNKGCFRHAQFKRNLLKFVVQHGALQEDHHRGVPPSTRSRKRINPPQAVTECRTDRTHLKRLPHRGHLSA